MTLLSRPNGSWIDRFLAAPLALLLIAGPGSLDAWAGQLSWKAPNSGNAGTASNWNPALVPTATDSTTFNVGGIYTVTIPSTLTSTSAQFYRSGAVTVVAASGHTIAGALRVGTVANDNGTLTLTNGTLGVGSFLTLGNPTGATGTMNLNASTATVLQSGSASDVIVGSSGTGTLNVTNGGRVDAGDDVLVGNGTGSQGTLLVSGVSASPNQRATVTSKGTDGDVIIGNGGTGNATVDFGGQLTGSDDVRIGITASGNGTLTVQNATGAFVSLLTVGDDLDIANNNVGGLAAGTGTLALQMFGQANVAGTTRVGDPEGGTGTLRIRPTTFFRTHDLIVNDAHGVLDWHGGTLSVDGGLCDLPGTTLLLDDPQFESLQLYNGATATFDGGSPAGYSLIVGDSEDGGLRVDSGSHVTNLNGVIAVAVAPGSVGVVDVYDSSLVDSVGMMVVGQGGFGELNVGSGSKIKLTDMKAAYFAGSNGFVDIAGAGTRVTLNTMEIGGHSGVAGGNASVNVGSGAVLDLVGGVSVPLRLVHTGAHLNVAQGGTVNAPNNLDNFGHIQMSGGVINTGSLNLKPGAELIGYGAVVGVVAATSADNLIHVPHDKTLTMGNAGSNKGFYNSGTMVLDTCQVNLLDLDGVTLGNVVSNSGFLTLPAAGGTVQAGRTINGSGDINGGPLIVGGAISPGFTPGIPRGAFGVPAYVQQATGVMTMEIGDAATIQYDRLQVTGSVTLAGSLEIRLLPGLVPDPGEDFPLITCASRSGTFSTVTYYGQPVGGQFTIVYNPTSVVLHVNQITTDAPPPGTLPRALSFSARSGASADAGFELALPEASRVALRVYNVTGRCLGTLFEGEHAAGVFALRLRDLPARLPGGVYFGRLRVQSGPVEQVRTAKVTLVR